MSSLIYNPLAFIVCLQYNNLLITLLSVSNRQIDVPPDEQNRVDSLRYAVERLVNQAAFIQDELISVQPTFKQELLSGIGVFHQDVNDLERGYALEGPMVPGITPREASDRLNMFQSRFDDIFRSYQTYSAGEQLFGLPITDYSCIHRIKKELNLLQKLYGLYNQVNVGNSHSQELYWLYFTPL